MEKGDIIRALAEPPEDEPLAVLGRAMEVLSGVTRLLEALSPADVEAMAARLHLGLERQADRYAVFWKVYVARHRVLTDVFATQRAELLARAARACPVAREDEP
jgi:hypothetical protein